jgi:hypothetical protein
VEFLDETLKFYQDPQLNIDAQQSRICKSLRTTWGIPETVQQSRSSPRPTQPTTPIPDLISTFPAAHLRPDASRGEVLAPGSACAGKCMFREVLAAHLRPDASRPGEAACTRHLRNGERKDGRAALL